MWLYDRCLFFYTLFGTLLNENWCLVWWSSLGMDYTWSILSWSWLDFNFFLWRWFDHDHVYLRLSIVDGLSGIFKGNNLNLFCFITWKKGGNIFFILAFVWDLWAAFLFIFFNFFHNYVILLFWLLLLLRWWLCFLFFFCLEVFNFSEICLH